LKHATLDDVITSLSTLLPDVDRAVLTDEFGEDLIASFHEALRVGVDGWLDDDLAFIKPWGLSLDEIAIPTMIWQGSADLMFPSLTVNAFDAVARSRSAPQRRRGSPLRRTRALDVMFDELVALAS